jgi:hypothetical protein
MYTSLTPRQKYINHKATAKRRGISFNLTFDEWMSIWSESGMWDLRGVGKGKYCMSRIGDTGNYELGNVFIQEFGKNISDAQSGKIRTEIEREQISKALIGRTFSKETIEKKRQAQLGKKHTKESIQKRIETFKRTIQSRKQGEIL